MIALTGGELVYFEMDPVSSWLLDQLSSLSHWLCSHIDLFLTVMLSYLHYTTEIDIHEYCGNLNREGSYTLYYGVAQNL